MMATLRATCVWQPNLHHLNTETVPPLASISPGFRVAASAACPCPAPQAIGEAALPCSQPLESTECSLHMGRPARPPSFMGPSGHTGLQQPRAPVGLPPGPPPSPTKFGGAANTRAVPVLIRGRAGRGRLAATALPPSPKLPRVVRRRDRHQRGGWVWGGGGGGFAHQLL
jgi:hypothetical protein